MHRDVAPRAGAWIETHPLAGNFDKWCGRPPRGGVDRNGYRTDWQLRKSEALADLIASHVETNPSALSEADLHAPARSVMEPIEVRAMEDSLGRLHAHLGRGDGLACTDPAELVAAAHAGRVDLLFLDAGVSLRGTFDAGTGDLSEVTQDLADQAAQMTLRTGGGALMVDPEHLPEGVGMAAILRY